MADASPVTRAITPKPRLVQLRDGLAHVFLGDWHPVLRDPLDLFRLSFPIGAAIFALGGDSNAGRPAPAPRCGRAGRAGAEHPSNDRLDLLRGDVLSRVGETRCNLFSQFWWYDNTVHITLPMSLAADPVHSVLAPRCRARPRRASG